MTQALERTRRRVDKYGVAEPAIYKQENDQIALQLPGMKNPQEAISFIKTAGRLEFKLLNTTGDLQKAIAGDVPRRQRSPLRRGRRTKREGHQAALSLV